MNEKKPPILPIPLRDLIAAIEIGYGLVRYQGQIVARIVPLEEPVRFRRGSDDDAILQRWEAERG